MMSETAMITDTVGGPNQDCKAVNMHPLPHRCYQIAWRVSGSKLGFSRVEQVSHLHVLTASAKRPSLEYDFPT